MISIRRLVVAASRAVGVVWALQPAVMQSVSKTANNRKRGNVNSSQKRILQPGAMRRRHSGLASLQHLVDAAMKERQPRANTRAEVSGRGKRSWSGGYRPRSR